MKIYYAHHIWKYNTEIEKYELDLIKSNFPHFEIINPNGYVDQSKTEKDIMNDCFDYVGNTDAIVFSSLSGVVGKGVVDEVMLAQSLHKAVFYIVNNKIIALPYITFDLINGSTNKRLYATVNM